MRKSIFTLVASISGLGLLGAFCQPTATNTNTTLNTNNSNTNVVVNENTNTSTTTNSNTNSGVNVNTTVNVNTSANTNASSNTNTTVNTNTSTNTNTNSSTNTNTTSNTNTTVNTNTTPEIVNATVTYNGSSFSAASVTISAGGTVTFVNNSTHSMQVSSDNHPSHTKNPEIGTGPVIAAGGTFKLTLDNKGTWGYHNHLNPSATGSITVK